MRRLLIVFSENPKKIGQALNCLGARIDLTVFLPDCEYDLYDVKEIRFDKERFARNPDYYIRKLKEIYYDEIYFLLDDMDTLGINPQKLAYELNGKDIYYILNDKLPCKTIQEAKLFDNKNWVLPLKTRYSWLRKIFGFSNKSSISSYERKSHQIPIYAIIGTYNEEDIIYATVKNAFAQGCDRVYLIDNNSTDNTIREATASGAILYRTFKTNYYDELLRIRIMNDAIEEISESSDYNEIWWLWLDADEFPMGPGGVTIRDFIRDVPSECRVIGANFINHFPVDRPYYIERYHPFDFMPYGEPYDTARFNVKHCQQGHWKHNMHKYIRGRPFIRAKSGFHMGYCKETLFEPLEAIDIHHFPFREKESTYSRYLKLCRGNDARNIFNDKMSPGGKSSISKRFENLGNIYSGNWDRVCFTPESSNKRGVRLRKYSFNGPRWYTLDELNRVKKEYSMNIME